MAVKPEESKAALVGKTIEHVRERLPRPKADQLALFVTAYYADAAPEDLQELDLYGPLVTKGSPSYNNPPWVVGQWYTGPNGAPVSQQTIRNVMGHAPASVRNSLNPNAATAYLSAHHYTQWSAY